MKALLCLTVLSLIGFANSAKADEDYCDKYPDSPVCVTPADPSQTFCQSNPGNPACGNTENENSNPQPTGPVHSGTPNTTAPAANSNNSGPAVVSSEDNNQVQPPSENSDNTERRQQQRTNIVLVTDQPGAAAALAIKHTFETTAPFACMNLKIEIREVSKEELGCNPRMSQPRLLYCDSGARSLANRIRTEINDSIVDENPQPRRRNFFQRIFGGGRRHHAEDAEAAIVVVDYDQWAGAGYERTPLVSTHLNPRGAIHELLHGLGYHDEYREGVYRPGGTIMNTIEGNVPNYWWPHIAEYFHTTAPTSCGNQ